MINVHLKSNQLALCAFMFKKYSKSTALPKAILSKQKLNYGLCKDYILNEKMHYQLKPKIINLRVNLFLSIFLNY
jgi:hypothetical protein